MRALTATLLLALALPAVAGTAPPATTPATTSARKPPPATAAAKRLPFVSDDYQKALAEARARNVPLVVDVWAPW